jgi:hypothetical protein
MKFLYNNHFYSNNQYTSRFIADKSTKGFHFITNNYIQLSLNQNYYVAGIFQDVKKVVYTVNHLLLLKKLENAGTR